MISAAECPHPECLGTIKVDRTVPAGVYPCICRAAEVRLEWVDDRPVLSLEPSGPAG